MNKYDIETLNFVETSEPNKVAEYIADLKAKLEQYEKFMKDNEWDSIEEMQKTLNECEKKYFDMQQQLAESEKYNKMLLEEKGGYIDLISGYSKKCKNYEQQLTEKEKEIEEMRHFKVTIGTMENNRVDISSTTYTDQKTDFAIEQLEKVKKFCEDNYDTFDDKIDNCKGKVIGLDKVIFIADMSLYDYIDQQIKELKHQHEDKGE